MLPNKRFVDHLLHALLQVKIMGYARGLLQQAAVVATSPVSAPIPSDAVNGQQVTHGGATPDSPSDSSSASPFYVNSHFSPTMIIILVILLSSFFFMGLFAVYVRRCTSEEGVSRRGSSRRIVRRDDLIVGSGVNHLLVESYPMVSYAAAKKKGCYECSVCLGDFEAGEQLKQLPKCKHVFHPGCIGLWLESHTTCPLCRRSLVNSDRWSMSFRWGGSSRGASLSTRRSGEESSRSRIGGGETAGSRWGRAGSSRGWFGRNEDASSRSRGDLQHETTSAHIVDTNDVESQALPTTSPALSSSSSSSQHGPALSSQHGLQASAQLSEAAQCGLAASVLSSEEASVGHAEGVLCNPSMQASSVSSELMPCGIQECCVCRDLMPPAEVAEAANAASEPRKPRQTAVLQWRRKLSRSNSTGHSLRRRAALQATGCMPFSLNRSRSVGRDGGDEEEVMCATPEHGPVSGSS